MKIPKSCKLVKTKQYYYHITDKDYEDTVTWKPRNWGENRSEEEPKTPKICVGSSVYHCLCALPLGFSKYYIYKTEKKEVAYFPFKVNDDHLTREKWLLHTTNFIRVGYIPSNNIDEIQNSHAPIGDGCEENKQNCIRIKNYIKSAIQNNRKWITTLSKKGIRVI